MSRPDGNAEGRIADAPCSCWDRDVAAYAADCPQHGHLATHPDAPASGRPDGDGGNVITCTHDGLAEHLWDPGTRCPDAIRAGTWAVHPAAPAVDADLRDVLRAEVASDPVAQAAYDRRRAADLRAELLTVIPAHPEVDEEDTADAVLALPALQRLVEQAAEAARLRAVVARVRDALNPDPSDYATAADLVYDARRALDGTDG